MTSPDGIIWTAQSSEIRLSNVSYCGNQFVGTDSANVWTSPDGIAWTKYLTDYFNLNAVAYGNNHFVAVGGAGTIVASPDAIAWTDRSSKASAWFKAVTFGGNQFVTVGPQSFDPTADAAILS